MEVPSSPAWVNLRKFLNLLDLQFHTLSNVVIKKAVALFGGKVTLDVGGEGGS